MGVWAGKQWTNHCHVGYDRGGEMNEGIILLLVVGVWVVLQAYILPKLGVPT